MISVQTILKGVHGTANFSELCRLCGSMKSPTISIFDESYRVSYHDIINFHFQDIQVSKDDTLPLKLCSDCAKFVMSWHQFYNSCVKVNQALSSVIEKFQFEPNTPLTNRPESKSNIEVIEIKPEDVPHDLENDDFLDNVGKSCDKLAESNAECVTGRYVFVDTNATANEKDDNMIPASKAKLSSDSLIPPLFEKGLGGAAGTTKCKVCGSVFLKSKVRSALNRGMCYACYSKTIKPVEVSQAFKNYLVVDENKQSYFVCDLCEFSCDACPDVFSHHYKTEHPGADLYQFSKRSKDPLKKFSRVIKGVRAYRCDRCTMSCISRNVFAKHYLEHNGIVQDDASLKIESKDGKFCCPVCQKSYTKKSGTKRHMKRVHGPKQYHCGVCLKGFPYEYQAHEHETQHKKLKSLICDLCGRGFVNRTNLATHMKNHGLSKFLCGWCDQRFDNKILLNKHFMKCAKKPTKVAKDEMKVQPESSVQFDKKNDVEVETKIQPEPSVQFDKKNNVEIEIETANQPEPSVQFDKKNVVEVETTIQPKPSVQVDQPNRNIGMPKIQIKFVPQTNNLVQKPVTNYQCAKCCKKFDSKLSLRLHIVKEFNLTPYDCYICDRLFPSTVLLKKHLKSCNDTILKNGRGDDNSLIIDNGNSFSCKLCGKKCSKKGYLQLHLRLHKNLKPYVCQYCGKSYVFKASFRAHMLSEVNQRTYACSTCGKRYNTSSHLTAHIKNNHRFREFKCTTCDREFAYDRDLKEHEKIHGEAKMFCCEKCGSMFKVAKYLKVHLDRCTGVKTPVTCLV